MGLEIITKEEYVLSSKEFQIEKKRKIIKNHSTNNRVSFVLDYASGELKRYKGTFVAYKEGILCGQSEDRELLYREVVFNLCEPDVKIFDLTKKLPS